MIPDDVRQRVIDLIIDVATSYPDGKVHWNALTLQGYVYRSALGHDYRCPELYADRVFFPAAGLVAGLGLHDTVNATLRLIEGILGYPLYPGGMHPLRLNVKEAEHVAA